LNEAANHFELMGLPVAFAIDGERLERGYRDLQARVHPDRFASSTGTEKRVAMQWAARANEAYRTLRDPVARARYLLGLRGFDTGEETDTSMPPDFLMQQMEWREAAAAGNAARDAGALEALREEIADSREAMLRQLERALDVESNYDAGCSLVRKLRFLQKLDEEIDDALHEIEEVAR
jgi:molecular chaperone HscB